MNYVDIIVFYMDYYLHRHITDELDSIKFVSICCLDFGGVNAALTGSAEVVNTKYQRCR